MAGLSHIDELVDFNYDVRSMIISNHGIMELLSDTPGIDMDGDDIQQYEERVKDHDYVDETSLTANAYIVIDTEMISRDTGTMKTMYLYVQVICSKGFMGLDPKKFKGVKGNRRDNLCRRVDNILNGHLSFGVGELHLRSATISNMPTGYSGRTLTYSVPNFA